LSKVAIKGASTGTATFTIESPATNTNRTLVLPDAAGTVVTDSATQTLTNKTVQGGTVQSATSQASTSGTSIDFTGIPSWVKRITVMFSGVSTNGSSNIQVQIGSGTFTTSGYLGSAAFANNANGTVASTFTAGFGVVVAGTASTASSGTVQLSLFGNNVWVSMSAIGRSDANAAAYSGGVSPSLSGSLDRVRITTVNGTDTFDAGSINILYE